MSKKVVIANGKKYSYVAGEKDKGIVTALGPRSGSYCFVRNVNNGRWCMLSGPRNATAKWLETFDVQEEA